MDIQITLNEQKMGMLISGLVALNKLPGRTLEESTAIINVHNELQAAISAEKNKPEKEKKKK